MPVQFLTILIINFTGILIQKFFNLPFPGAIIGMLLFFILLYFKIIKVERIEKVCDFLLKNMVILFLAPAVDLLYYIEYLKADFFKIILLIVVTTVITMGVTARTVQFFLKRMEGR